MGEFTSLIGRRKRSNCRGSAPNSRDKRSWLLNRVYGAIQRSGVAGFVADHSKQPAVGRVDHEALRSQAGWNSGVVRLPGRAIISRAPDGGRIGWVRIVTIEQVASCIPSQRSTSGRVVVAENIGPAESAGGLRGFPNATLGAEKNIAVAVESDRIDVAVANGVRRIDVGIRR
jgi:hypothetical protein